MASSAGKRLRTDDLLVENDLSKMEPNITQILNDLKDAIFKINTKLDDLPGITSELKLINENINNIKTDINNNKTLINKNCAQVDKIEGELCDVKLSVAQMESKIEFIEREKRQLNLIVSKLPFNEKINDIDTVVKMGELFKLNLQNKISYVKRLPNKVKNGYSPLLISIKDLETKNKIISEYISLRSSKHDITMRDLGLSELNEPIYISEHITPRANQLFYMAREAHKSEPKFFLSSITRNGRVAVKISTDNKYIYINNENDLFSLCSEKTKNTIISKRQNEKQNMDDACLTTDSG